MSERIQHLLKPSESIVQTESFADKLATLTTFKGRYYFYLETKNTIETREVEHDKIFDLNRIADWVSATRQLSRKKQEMRVPTQCVMRAVGFRPEDVDLFLDNETKSGLSAELRRMEWYKNAHPEIQTAILKLFAHLGLFEQQNIKRRLVVVQQVIDAFTLLEIHNLFGGLNPGTCLKQILKEQDSEQAIDSEVRRRFDPTGKKAINFFLKNMSNPEFKENAQYALTHYVYEMALYNSQKKSANARLESYCAICGIKSVSTIANSINAKHEELADVLYRYDNGINSLRNDIVMLQDEMEALRANLHKAITLSDNAYLEQLLVETSLAKQPFSLDHIKQHCAEVHFSHDIPSDIAEKAILAGYKTYDEREVVTLSHIYEMAKTAPAKCFDMFVQDSSSTACKYVWLSPSDPSLYTIAMLCGNTCMRPGFAGEAALWESALSDDVAMGAILEHDKVVAYYRVNYDKVGKGIYVDTVESRFSNVLNSEGIWAAVRRAVIEMAQSMNNTGNFPVHIINFREERGNRLKIQWERLPISTQPLRARAYHHPKAPWSYGDNNTRVQKEVWRSNE